MKLNRDKFQLAMARACFEVKDLVFASGLPRPSINNAIQGKQLRPATIGRIAKALGVDVTEILEKEET